MFDGPIMYAICVDQKKINCLSHIATSWRHKDKKNSETLFLMNTIINLYLCTNLQEHYQFIYVWIQNYIT